MTVDTIAIMAAILKAADVVAVELYNRTRRDTDDYSVVEENVDYARNAVELFEATTEVVNETRRAQVLTREGKKCNKQFRPKHWYEKICSDCVAEQMKKPILSAEELIEWNQRAGLRTIGRFLTSSACS